MTNLPFLKHLAMEKLVLKLIAVLSFFCFVSCSEIDKLTQFNLTYNSSFTIPSSSLVDLPISLTTPDVETNSESKFESNNTKKDLIEEITLSKCALKIESPVEGDFGFLKSVFIYIKADGLNEVLIASKDDVPAEIGNILELETTNENLKEYIKKDSYSLKVKTTTDETIKSDHEIDIESVFYVDAKILGI